MTLRQPHRSRVVNTTAPREAASNRLRRRHFATYSTRAPCGTEALCRFHTGAVWKHGARAMQPSATTRAVAQQVSETPTMTDRRTAAFRIAADTGHDPRSVLAVFDGRRVLPSTRKAVEAAAERLNINLRETIAAAA